MGAEMVNVVNMAQVTTFRLIAIRLIDPPLVDRPLRPPILVRVRLTVLTLP